MTHDLSTSGYGTSISNDYYKKSYSHNTIVIDGKNQNLECDTIVYSFDENLIDIDVKNVYENISISRKIQLLSKDIVDEVRIDYCDKNVDYFFIVMLI